MIDLVIVGIARRVFQCHSSNRSTPRPCYGHRLFDSYPMSRNHHISITGGSNRLLEEVRQSLTPGIQTQVLDAAVDVFGQHGNSMRVNLFACAIRELFRIVVAEMASDSDVRCCDWFVPDKTAKNGVTRKDRLRYAVHGGIAPDYVLDILNVDVEGSLKSATKLVNTLNRFTHVGEKTLAVSVTEANRVFRDSLQTVNELFGLIEELQRTVWQHLHDALVSEVSEALFQNVFDALDELSTHTSVDEAHVDDFQITRIDACEIIIEGAGIVDVRLQYGSNSDLKKDIGVISSDGFPFKFTARSSVLEPNEIMLSPNEIDFDNTKWWQ